MMTYVIGAVLALAVCGAGTIFRLDRDRAFYPIMMIVIAAFYGLFAVMGGSARALMQESIAIAIFFALAIAGFKRNLWIVVIALFAHGVFDFVHPGVIPDPGVPAWWPAACLTYDIVAAAYLAVLLKTSSVPVRRELPNP